MDVEEQSFIWTIDNFSVIRLHKSIINAQKIHFSAGSRVGHPSRWSVSLQHNLRDGKKWLGIYFRVEEPPATDPSWKNVFTEMKFALEGVKPRWSKTTKLFDVPGFTKSQGRGFHEMFALPEAEVSTEEKLVIRHNFKLYVPRVTEDECQLTLEAFQVKFANRAKKDFRLLLKNPSPGKDIKIISKDKKEFTVQKGILAVRSLVLEAMMGTDMLEANSGVIQLPDISSRGLKVLLAFLYTGELNPDWSEPEVVVELTNAAAKYQLQDLLKFFDVSLGNVCKTENVLALFTLAHELSLRTAERELTKFIHAHSCSPFVFGKMLRGISLPGGNGDVDSPRKRKSRLWSRFTRSVRLLFGRNEKKN